MVAVPSLSVPVASRRLPQEYTLGEEIASSVSHGVGAVLALVGLAVLVVKAAGNGDGWHVVSSAIFGASLVLTYGASTLYHAARDPEAKRVLKTIDHMAVYLLIAGTYTPFTLVTLRGAWGWSIFAIVWALAVVGMCAEALWARRPRWITAGVGMAMGWMVIVAVRPMLERLPPAGVWLVAAGGLAYTIGVVFYMWKSVRYMHAVWHAWVIAGSVFQFFAVLYHVVP